MFRTGGGNIRPARHKKRRNVSHGRKKLPTWFRSMFFTLLICYNPSRNLRLATLGAVTVLLVFMASSIVLAFSVTVAPYGWPRYSYYLTVPANDRAVFFTVIVITYLCPSIVSVIMYSLLYHKIKLKITKVGAKPETVQNQSNFEFGNAYVKDSKSDLDLIFGTLSRSVM
jgi:hypothetical protein